MYEGKKVQMAEENLEKVTGGLDIEAPAFFDDPSVNPGPGPFSFPEEIHYDQIVLEDSTLLENLRKGINGAGTDHE